MNAYDFDNTIYDGESIYDFFIFAIKTDKKLLKFFPRIFILLIKYKLNKVKITDIYDTASLVIEYFINESNLSSADRAIYDASYKNLEKVMINPKRPNKNKGEACSLAYAKATGIPVFATDEMDLQPIIDKQLNTGIDDITCLRIVDIIKKAKSGEIDVARKVCKALWVISGKSKDIFDNELWPVIAE